MASSVEKNCQQYNLLQYTLAQFKTVRIPCITFWALINIFIKNFSSKKNSYSCTTKIKINCFYSVKQIALYNIRAVAPI